MVKTEFFAERNEDGQLVVGKVVVDEEAVRVFTHKTPLGKTYQTTEPIYRKILQSKVLDSDTEDRYWDVLEGESQDYWYDTEDRVIEYFLNGRKLTSEEYPIIIEERQSWLDRILPSGIWYK